MTTTKATINAKLLGICILSALLLTGAALATDCEQREIRISGDDHETEELQIPDLELGESWQGRSHDGRDLLVTCVELGMRLDIEGEPVATFRENEIRVGSDDGGVVTVFSDGEGDSRSRIVVISEEGSDEQSFTMTLGDDGSMRMWSDGDEGGSEVRIDTETSKDGSSRTVTRITIESEDLDEDKEES